MGKAEATLTKADLSVRKSPGGLAGRAPALGPGLQSWMRFVNTGKSRLCKSSGHDYSLHTHQPRFRSHIGCWGRHGLKREAPGPKALLATGGNISVKR